MQYLYITFPELLVPLVMSFVLLLSKWIEIYKAIIAHYKKEEWQVVSISSARTGTSPRYPGLQVCSAMSNFKSQMKLVDFKSRRVLFKLGIVCCSIAISWMLVSANSKGGEEEEAFDPYAILGTDRDADLKTIKKAYRSLALVYHVDRDWHSIDQAKFMVIAKAYEILSDPRAKENWDKYGNVDGRLTFELAIRPPYLWELAVNNPCAVLISGAFASACLFLPTNSPANFGLKLASTIILTFTCIANVCTIVPE